ncbi:GNAT family N-acetyltransferase [Candidatus Obscuribacterales bacterium]|jgi:GNAT superfamily N-acetyltransferase|nr:GNAT family N-acetyltransferase [Candidatus Obscuribacterales bacterium]MBX3135292.1 GNAT family N-acetyltransferase [Candidatus Obscuribacterales bacterium]MBX3153426.1 GNAT family N-acetyltransferase [Candidatus Obscuribacterales bacterium]
MMQMQKQKPTVRTDIEIRPIEEQHREWLKSRVQEIWNGRFVVSRGISYEPWKLPGFLAVRDGVTVGVATYYVHDSECELITLDSFTQWAGVGTALIDAVEEEARKQACGRMWMITTNDNLDGLRFYQRRGYVICAVHPNAIDESRKLKPSIPLVGNYGIDIRDEIELEKNLWCWIGW